MLLVYTVGLLAAVATGKLVGLAAVVMIESVEKQKKIVRLRRDHNLKEQDHYQYQY